MTQKENCILFYDKLAEKYESSYTEPYWQLYNEVTWHNIKKYIPEKKNAIILDAGGGTGLWSRRLAKLGFRLICTDISQKMLDIENRFNNEPSIASLSTHIQIVGKKII